MDLDGPAEALQLHFAGGCGLNAIVDRGVNTRTNENLAARGVRAQTGGKVHDWAERPVVVSAGKADSTERRVPCLDSNAERDINAPLSPSRVDL